MSGPRGVLVAAIVVMGCRGPSRTPGASVPGDGGSPAAGSARDAGASVAAAVEVDAVPGRGAPDGGAAEEECVLGEDAIAGTLDHAAPGVKTITAPIRHARRLEEAVVLADGTSVRFEVGGCAHFYYVFVFHPLEVGGVGRRSAERIRTAIALLRKTPVKGRLAADLIDALARPGPVQHDRDGVLEVSCGEALCSIAIAPVPGLEEGRVQLRVGYDFAL